MEKCEIVLTSDAGSRGRRRVLQLGKEFAGHPSGWKRKGDVVFGVLSRLTAKAGLTGRNPGRGSPIIVLGMHRSGTSFLTGSLQLAGLALGQHSVSDRYNQKGNRENAGFVGFHNDVLAQRANAWDNPPAETIVWTEAERLRAQSLVASFDATTLWGFKDPRTLLMMDEWQLMCPQAAYIGIFRNPVAVVRSLVGRRDILADKATALWVDYNQRLLDFHKKKPFALLCFDEDEPTLHTKINRIFPKMGLSAIASDRFFRQDLKHHTQESDVIPPDLARLYAELQARKW